MVKYGESQTIILIIFLKGLLLLLLFIYLRFNEIHPLIP